jgi:hypothetical protein
MGSIQPWPSRMGWRLAAPGYAEPQTPLEGWNSVCYFGVIRTARKPQYCFSSLLPQLGGSGLNFLINDAGFHKGSVGSFFSLVAGYELSQASGLYPFLIYWPLSGSIRRSDWRPKSVLCNSNLIVVEMLPVIMRSLKESYCQLAQEAPDSVFLTPLVSHLNPDTKTSASGQWVIQSSNGNCWWSCYQFLRKIQWLLSSIEGCLLSLARAWSGRA